MRIGVADIAIEADKKANEERREKEKQEQEEARLKQEMKSSDIVVLESDFNFDD